MIDHNHRVIFVHIARCGGTTIENMFLGRDQWSLNKNEKHIPALVARKLYEPYWSTYYKFAVVRNPFDRIRSMWKYNAHYGLTLNSDGEIQMRDYARLWGEDKVCETNRYVDVDVTEFYRCNLRLEKGSAYQNLLADGVHVYKFEEFAQILEDLRNKFDLPSDSGQKIESSIQKKPPLSQESIEYIQRIHKNDFDFYGYDSKYSLGIETAL